MALQNKTAYYSLLDKGVLILDLSKSILFAKDIKDEMLSTYFVSQNFPNPFNPETKINYSIPKKSEVSIIVYDLLGRKVEELLNEQKNKGDYTILFKASNLPSGVYFLRVRAGGYAIAKKMVLVK